MILQLLLTFAVAFDPDAFASAKAVADAVDRMYRCSRPNDRGKWDRSK